VKTVEPAGTPASVCTSIETGIVLLPGGHGSSATGSPLTFAAGSTATRRLTARAGFGTPLRTSNAIGVVVAAVPVTDGTGADTAMPASHARCAAFGTGTGPAATGGGAATGGAGGNECAIVLSTSIPASLTTAGGPVNFPFGAQPPEVRASDLVALVRGERLRPSARPWRRTP